MDTPLFLLSTTPTFVEGSHVHSWFTGHRQHLLLALWQVIKWKITRTQLRVSSSSLCKQMSTFTGNSDVAVASACIICVPIYYNEKFAAALTRCANTNTRSFSKSSPKLQINKSNNKMKTWSQKHDTISCGWTNTSPAPAPPPSAALCPESAWSSSGWIFCSFMALCGSSLTPQWQLCMVH